MMRSVSFVERLELDFSGNHFSHALALGDVDSDELNELVIANAGGVLAVFKGDTSSKPWRECSKLGTITCVGIGDIFNNGKNAVVCINAEGMCHIITVDPESSLPVSPKHFSYSSSPSTQRKASSKTMKPSHSQQLEAPNVKVMLIASIAPDGENELFVGHTDRYVCVYRWSAATSSLQSTHKFPLSGQIGSLSVTMATNGSPQLLVSQPGGTYIPLCYCSEIEESVGSPRHSLSSKRKWKAGMVLTQQPPVGQPQRRNPTASTEMVGNIKSRRSLFGSSRALESSGEGGVQAGSNNTVALCTLEGAVRMLRDEKKLWELQVDHSLFAIEKLDVTGNGEEEIVVCAWDAMTYIIDQSKNIVRYQFEENVSAFCAGHYGMTVGGNKPCMIYTTFSNKIYVYYNITLPAISPSNLLLTMKDMALPEELIRKLEGLDDTQKQALFHRCLYGSEDSTAPILEPCELQQQRTLAST